MVDMVITDQNFEFEVLRSTKPVLVDFWAVWCRPCQVRGPDRGRRGQSDGRESKVGKLNVDENPQMAQKYSVMSIRQLMVFKEWHSRQAVHRGAE